MPLANDATLPKYCVHGTELEALYCTAYVGRLMENMTEYRGERFLHGAPGVYLHRYENDDKKQRTPAAV